MDVLLNSLLVVNGAMLAWIIIDFSTRMGAKAGMEKATKDYIESSTKLSALHNESAKKIIEMTDKIAAHDYQLTAKVSPSPFGKR